MATWSGFSDAELRRMKQQEREKEEVLKRREQDRLAKQSMQSTRRQPARSKNATQKRGSGEEQAQQQELDVDDSLSSSSQSQREQKASHLQVTSEAGLSVRSSSSAGDNGTAISFEWCVIYS